MIYFSAFHGMLCSNYIFFPPLLLFSVLAFKFMPKHSRWKIGHDKIIFFTIKVFRKYKVLRAFHIIFSHPFIRIVINDFTSTLAANQSASLILVSLIYTHILKCPSPKSLQKNQWLWYSADFLVACDSLKTNLYILLFFSPRISKIKVWF